MANQVEITIRDRSKTAVCREVLAMCGTYQVTVAGMDGNGHLVLHEGCMPPVGNGVTWVARDVDQARWYGYCALTGGSGTLTLNSEELAKDLTERYRIGTRAPVYFTVYKTGEGVIGTGAANVLVTEPYELTPLNLVSFRGPQGERGERGEKGDRGPVAEVGMVRNATSGKWHRLHAVVDEYGYTAVEIDQTPEDNGPEAFDVTEGVLYLQSNEHRVTGGVLYLKRWG